VARAAAAQRRSQDAAQRRHRKCSSSHGALYPAYGVPSADKA
jgi:hypothetical protein